MTIVQKLRAHSGLMSLKQLSLTLRMHPQTLAIARRASLRHHRIGQRLKFDPEIVVAWVEKWKSAKRCLRSEGSKRITYGRG